MGNIYHVQSSKKLNGPKHSCLIGGVLPRTCTTNLLKDAVPDPHEQMVCAELCVVESLVSTNCFSQHYQAAIHCMCIAQQVRKCSGDTKNYIVTQRNIDPSTLNQGYDGTWMMLHSLHHRKMGWRASLYLICTLFKITNTAARFLFSVF